MEELASNYDIETPQYKEKQTILPHPMSEMEKKQQTPVKRTHDGKIKLKVESSKKYQGSPMIDMRKLERTPTDDLTSIMNNSSLLESSKTPHKSKKKDKNHEKSSEKKKKSSKKDPVPSTTIRIESYNLNRDEERCFKRLHAPSTSTPSDKENNVHVNSIESMIVKETEPVHCEIVSMEMDDIPVVAEEVVVEETVIETTPSTNMMSESSDLHISIQSTPHYTEEIVTETIVAFPTCSQTAP